MTRFRAPDPDVPFLRLVAVVIGYAVAMAYLESAVVVYLREALGVAPSTVFPVDLSGAAGSLGYIELGRELATLVMIATVGWIAGRSPLERLAWAAVVFGIWDIGYYAWLWVFSGWPTGLGTWDLLFLLPVPWAGPVWAPVAVSLGLVGFGLAVAARLRVGRFTGDDHHPIRPPAARRAGRHRQLHAERRRGDRWRRADQLRLARLRGRHGARCRGGGRRAAARRGSFASVRGPSGPSRPQAALPQVAPHAADPWVAGALGVRGVGLPVPGLERLGTGGDCRGRRLGGRSLWRWTRHRGRLRLPSAWGRRLGRTEQADERPDDSRDEQDHQQSSEEPAEAAEPSERAAVHEVAHPAEPPATAGGGASGEGHDRDDGQEDDRADCQDRRADASSVHRRSPYRPPPRAAGSPCRACGS